MKVQITLECDMENLSAVLSAIAPHCDRQVVAVKFSPHRGAVAQLVRPQRPAGALSDPSAEHSGSTTMRTKSLAQKSGAICKDPRFQVFLLERYKDAFANAGNDPAEFVRQRCCVGSRREIGASEYARLRWQTLDSEYTAWLMAPEEAAG